MDFISTTLMAPTLMARRRWIVRSLCQARLVSALCANIHRCGRAAMFQSRHSNYCCGRCFETYAEEHDGDNCDPGRDDVGDSAGWAREGSPVSSSDKSPSSLPSWSPSSSSSSSSPSSSTRTVEVKHSKRSGLSHLCFLVSPVSVLLGIFSDFRAVSFAAV